jgi:formate dehydrogenase
LARGQAQIKQSGLRGLGGAGFPSGTKWGFVRSNAGPRYLAVNGDEGEPGTFKDRYYLERTPHLFLEGMLIAAWAVEAETCFIYMRDEYPAVLHILAQEIALWKRRARACGLY